MNIKKALKRDRARDKRNKGMQISNKSIFLIQEILIKRGNKARKDTEVKHGS